ncbi:MAG: ParB N-terminal domain-containing protein [Bacteroidetes bacterium]|nr:ParB N-terminal domain-containing protein [Bacteroidota bacterium]
MPENDNITRFAFREIISEHANEINLRKTHDATPSTEVIFFRNEHRKPFEREVVHVPSENLRFRKDNGRIISDVFSYEKDKGTLTEKSETAQNIIREFLLKKDPEKTNELINSIKVTGQRQPAIITCDGFLINGNRRKVAIDKLYDDTGDDQYSTMKVVILPGPNDPGGPPTIKEIEQIENRYQLQSEGKSEYYGFDKALSMRYKIQMGMSLKDQLKDDPQFANHTDSQLKRVIKKYYTDYLNPLECIDDYLSMLDRDGLYSTISTGPADREGRWQAFIDYYSKVKQNLTVEKNRIKMFGIDESEIGNIEEIAFKLIRKREFRDLPKVHQLMRELPKLIKNPHSKKELYNLLNIEFELYPEESFDTDGNEYEEKEKDRIWGKKHESSFLHRVKKAKQYVDYEKERESSITLLEAALAKLEHENMEPEAVEIVDLKKAMNLSKEIKETADELESQFYHLQKNWKKQLKDNFN